MDSTTRKSVATALISAAEKLEQIRPCTIFDVVDAIHSGDPNAITASSLGRIWEHTNDLTRNSFVIISACRAIFSSAKNLERTADLQKMVKNMGYGYVRLIGHWRECQELDDNGNPVPYENCPEEKLKDVTEASVFVPGMALGQGQMLAKKFNQDSFIYGGPQTEGLVKVLTQNGTVIDVLGSTLTTQVIKQAFSSIYNATRMKQAELARLYKDRRFSFLNVATDQPTEAMSAAAYEKKKYGTKKFHSIWGQR